MSSICKNRLTLWSDLETLEKIKTAAAPPTESWLDHLLGRFGVQRVKPMGMGLFQFLCPIPDNVDQLDIEVVPQLAHMPKSYFWQVKNWGCCRDVLLNFEQTGESELCANFPTEYSPPVAALQHGAKLHSFRFRLLYCETGNEFCGIATECDNTEFELAHDRTVVENNIPAELIDAFGLNQADTGL